jgi:superfamily II DNA or RNA helicase
MELRPYQIDLINNAAKLIGSGKQKIVVQLATGGGKTFTFSGLIDRYLKRNQDKSVLILVHREELLTQTRKTLFAGNGIIAQEIVSGMKTIPKAKVYVGMVESVNRKLQKNQNCIPNVGLLIIDEVHINSFRKIHEYFPSSIYIGFTATPVSASKKDPIKNHFEDIVCGVDIPDLINLGSLVQCHTYSPKNVNTSSFKVRMGEFDEAQMGEEFSKAKHVQNTLNAYKKLADGTKTIIFNCNINHSKLVADAFTEAGYDVRHLDGTSVDRRIIFQWFKETPGAILCNCNVATTGFDEPSVQTVIMNRATLSLPLWLQCTGRGARPYTDKDYFTIIDMGSNATMHGDWCDQRDWYKMFHEPPKAKDKLGVAPIKECPKCEAIIPAQARECKVCGFVMPVKEEEYDALPIELELVTKNLIVTDLVERNADRKDYFTLFQIGNNLATQAKYRMKVLDNNKAEKLLEVYHEKAKEWCQLKGKRWNEWHKNKTKEHLYAQLEKTFHVSLLTA